MAGISISPDELHLTLPGRGAVIDYDRKAGILRISGLSPRDQIITRAVSTQEGLGDSQSVIVEFG
jgi:hypothetical protein